jgi:anti-sigma B factor antagonist
MKYPIKTINNVSIFKPVERFDAYHVPDLDSSIEMALSQSPCIVMDFSEVTFADTRALAMMVKWLKKTRELGGDLKLCALHQSVRVILELSKLDKVFKIYTTVNDAIAAFDDKASPSKTSIADVSQTDDIHIIELRNRIDAFSVQELKMQFEVYGLSENQRFIVDLSHVDFLDSAGLALLVKLLKQARAKQGDVVLVWSQVDTANRILKLTQFDKVFHIVNSVNEGRVFFGLHP